MRHTVLHHICLLKCRFNRTIVVPLHFSNSELAVEAVGVAEEVVVA